MLMLMLIMMMLFVPVVPQVFLLQMHGGVVGEVLAGILDEEGSNQGDDAKGDGGEKDPLEGVGVGASKRRDGGRHKSGCCMANTLECHVGGFA